MLALNGGTKVRNAPWPTWPERGDSEVQALDRVVKSGRWGGFPAPGTEATRFAQAWSRYTGAKHTIMAANGTVTLKVALRALGIRAGDEVIVPPLTWIATAGAAVYLNAVPVFADVDPDTLCLDPKAVEAQITPKTKAIIPVHLGSSMADMDALMAIAKKHDLVVIEDCAHAHGMRWNDRAAGTIGHAGSFSFQSSKLLTSGEGGAITTDDDAIADKCLSLTNCGRKEDDARFEGLAFGWNDRMTEMQCALLCSQLERLEAQHARRKDNLGYFERRLGELGSVGVTVQKRDARVTRHAFYQLVMLYDARQYKGLARDKFVAAMRAEGVPVDGAFYAPIYDRVGELFPLEAADYPEIRARYGDRLEPSSVSCPIATKAAYDRTVWLHHALFLGTRRDIDDIVDAIVKIREQVDALL